MDAEEYARSTEESRHAAVLRRIAQLEREVDRLSRALERTDTVVLRLVNKTNG